MKKSTAKHKLFTKWFIAFLAIAIVFLAVGFGTLGSTATVGDAFELKTARASSDPPTVVVHIDRSGTDEEGESYTLDVKHIYVNVASIYAAAGTPGVLRMEYGSGVTSFSSSRRMDVELENFYTAAKSEEGNTDEKVSSVCPDALFHWVAPFDDALKNWTSTYAYIRFTAMTHDLLINEIVFVGEKVVDSKSTGEYMVIPATVEKATPNSTEKPEEAVARAQAALFDAQAIPSEVQSSYYNYTKDELYTLSTLAEMRRGGEYDEALSSSAYHVEGVYGSLGIDVIALGTLIFGTSPFGVRFFPMLAAFGILIFGYLFVKQLTKSEKAGVVFAALYALCNLSFSLGHVGNPLMIGVFFFVASLYFCHKFYAHGMKKTSTGSVPLILSGLFGAAAICVNGAFLIPVAGVVALFICGLVRQQKARRYHLDAAIAEAEAEGAGEESREQVARVLREYRSKNIAAVVSFVLTLLLGSVLFALVFAIPLYVPYLRLYTTASSANIFVLAANAFAGGFIGRNPGAFRSAWDLFAVIFEGTGTQYAVTAIVVNAVAAVAGVFGIAFAAYRIIRILLNKQMGKAERSELRTYAVPLVGLLISLVPTFFGGGALAFLMLTYVFAFVLAAHAATSLTESNGKSATAAKACVWIGFALLIAVFALYAIFTFSIPVSSGLITKILG